MSYSGLDGIVGMQAVNATQLDDTTSRIKTGTILPYYDNYWGGCEVMYGYATGSIRQFGLCTITPTFATNTWRTQMAEVANTANLAQSLCVAMSSMTVGQYGWFMVTGLIPVNCSAAVAADTSFGIAATGQGGAVAAGKQILNARIVAASTTTVAKTASSNSGATVLQVSNPDGWFMGAYLSGTGIAALTVVTGIDPSGTQVTISVATTAAVNGTVTATYNNATVYYNVAYIERPFAQGAIT